MPRTAPSGADAALVAELAHLGLEVSQAQLERWRAAFYLPRHPRRGLGRGLGSTSQVLPQTVARAALLAQASRQGRALAPAVAWAAWSADGVPGGMVRLRAALMRELDCYGRRLAAVSARDDEGWQQRYNAADAAARRLPGQDQHALLRAVAVTAAGDPAAVPALPGAVHRGLGRTVARLLAGGGEDVAEQEFIDAVREAWPGQAVLPQARTGASGRRSGTEPPEEWAQFPLAAGWTTLLHTVRSADDQTLRRAVELVTATCSALEIVLVSLGPAALAGAPPPAIGLELRVEPTAMLTALNDPMWEAWGRHMPLKSDSPAWPTAAAFQTALTILLPGRAGALAAYRERTQSLITRAAVH